MPSASSGRLIGIGVGPGDSGLVTLKAVEALRKLEVVFVPQAAIKKDSLALQIAREHILDTCEVVNLLFPMVRAEEELSEHWRLAAEPVAQRLAAGTDCGFLTLGDPMLYSTFIYLHEAVSELVPTAGFESIPGISAGFAAASRAGLALARGDESVAFITGERANRLDRLIDEFDTIVIMKVGKRLAGITKRLTDLGVADRSVLAQRLGLDGEALIPITQSSDDEEAGYMSTIIVRCNDE